MMSLIKYFKSEKNYISEPDRFLTRFDQQYPNKSTSQQKEIEEYQNLFNHRDMTTKNQTLT
jgi:hypothetical protein